MLGFPQLETYRLKLVQIDADHTKSYFEMMSQDEVTKYYGMESLKNMEDAAKIVASFQQTYEDEKGIRWGIMLNASEKLVGTVGLNNLSMWSKKAEIGFELHPSYWHQGIAAEAVEEILRYSFMELGLYRIGAVTYPQNEPSIRLLEKLGFQKEGWLRGYIFQRNESHDALIFSLLRPEWVEKNENTC